MQDSCRTDQFIRAPREAHFQDQQYPKDQPLLCSCCSLCVQGRMKGMCSWVKQSPSTQVIHILMLLFQAAAKQDSEGEKAKNCITQI